MLHAFFCYNDTCPNGSANLSWVKCVVTGVPEADTKAFVLASMAVRMTFERSEGDF